MSDGCVFLVGFVGPLMSTDQNSEMVQVAQSPKATVKTNRLNTLTAGGDYHYMRPQDKRSVQISPDHESLLDNKNGLKTPSTPGGKPVRGNMRKRSNDEADKNGKRLKPNGNSLKVQSRNQLPSKKSNLGKNLNPCGQGSQVNQRKALQGSGEKRICGGQESQQKKKDSYVQENWKNMKSKAIETDREKDFLQNWVNVESHPGSGCTMESEVKSKSGLRVPEIILGNSIAETQRLRRQLSEKSEALQKAEDKAMALQHDNEILHRQLEEIKGKRLLPESDNQTQVIKHLELQKRNIENDKKTLEDQNTSMRLKLKEIQMKAEEKEAQHVEYTVRIDALIDDILASKETQEQKLLSKIEALKTEAEQKEMINCSLKRENKAAANEIEKLQDEIEEKESNFENRIEEMENMNNGLAIENAQLKNDIERIANGLEEMENQKKRLANENTVLKKDIEIIASDFEKKIEQMGTQNDYLQARYRESTLEIERLKKEKDRIAEKIQELEKQKEEVSIQRNVFQEKRLELEAKLEKIEKEKENKKRELEGRADQIWDILQHMINQ